MPSTIIFFQILHNNIKETVACTKNKCEPVYKNNYLCETQIEKQPRYFIEVPHWQGRG